MILDNSTLRVSGNSIKFWIGTQIENFGKFLSDCGASIVLNNKTKIVSNPNAKLFNPFTLVVNFTVDNNDKFQIILQGDYKDKYKDAFKEQNGDANFDITEKELFMIIYQHKNSWFKKE